MGEYPNGHWVFEDTGEKVAMNKPRPCGKCHRSFRGSDIGEADACLGELPGVKNACCGHGRREESYIMFDNGVTVRSFELCSILRKKIWTRHSKRRMRRRILRQRKG